jgi:hypothetical protein
MNIFVIEQTPEACAKSMCNKHVVKMVVESAQLLCTALVLNGAKAFDIPYKSTHTKHPCSIWTAESKHNFSWLYTHAIALCDEYTSRYGRVHKTRDVIESLTQYNVGDLQQHTKFAQAMPPEWKHEDAVTAYRCYYISNKCLIAKWAPRARPPIWWPFVETIK